MKRILQEMYWDFCEGHLDVILVPQRDPPNPAPMRRTLLMRNNLDGAMLDVSHCNAAKVAHASTVNHLDFIALDKPEHSHAMARLLLGKSERSGYIGGEESMHIFSLMHNA